MIFVRSPAGQEPQVALKGNVQLVAGESFVHRRTGALEGEPLDLDVRVAFEFAFEILLSADQAHETGDETAAARTGAGIADPDRDRFGRCRSGAGQQGRYEREGAERQALAFVLTDHRTLRKASARRIRDRARVARAARASADTDVVLVKTSPDLCNIQKLYSFVQGTAPLLSAQ